ncbi:ComEC/Rec2 family competence protein [Anaerococcus hydrogenalis]|uniref:ComEC/Rec2 family competence protein n=1 Tax=Anaerococcus hydrogenalis TaxID=33029 RepID=UPI00288BEE32|nr:ComEC/Rec2 family competence protein [Anaerococcus hydrogenalis]
MKAKIKNILIIFLSLIFIFLLINTKEDKGHKNLQELEINYIDVGQGNAVLIQSNDKTLLIDGGNRSNSSYYYNFIKNKNVKKIDYMIASHYDEDHIAGLISILENYEVSNVLCPNYKKDTKIYKSFKKSLKKSNANIIYPKKGDKFNISDAKLQILWPNEYKQGVDNDNSIVVKLRYGNMSFLFPADASTNVEDQLIYSGFNLKSDVLMLGHHGSKYSTSKQFLKEVDPKLAIISVGKNNRYGHPSSRVLKTLNDKNIKILRTDKDGDISIKCDGEKIKITAKKTNKK